PARRLRAADRRCDGRRSHTVRATGFGRGGLGHRRPRARTKPRSPVVCLRMRQPRTGRGPQARRRRMGVNVVVDELPALQRLVALEFSARAEEAIDARGRFVVALPGGSVASAFFPRLARAPINWGRVELFWIDERAVPPDHPDSNYALAARLLLRPAGIVPSRVHRMRGEVEDLEDAARRASDDFTAIAGNPAQIDLALVGVGEDGHI